MADVGTEQIGKLKIFVSYAREDLVFADQLVAGLEVTGFQPLIDRHEVQAAENFRNRLRQLILEADTVAFVLSPSSVANDAFTLWEVEEASRLSKRVIPVVCCPLGDAAVPEQLKNLNYIFFYPEPDAPGSGFGAGLQRLVSALNSDLDWLREHTRLGQHASEWDRSGRGEERLLRGQLLVSAQQWLLNRPRTAPQPTALQLAYIEASEQVEAAREDAARLQLEERERLLKEAEAAAREREQAYSEREEARRRSVKLQRSLMVGAVVSALFFALVGLFAWQAKKEATAAQIRAEVKEREAVEARTQLAISAAGEKEQRERAERETQQARLERDRAENALRELENFKGLVQVSEQERSKLETENLRFVVNEAKNDLLANRISGALERGLKALPDHEQNRIRPFVEGAEAVVFEALQSIPRPLFTLKHVPAGVGDVRFSADGVRALIVGQGSTVTLLDTTSHAVIKEFKGQKAAFSRDGKRIAVASANGLTVYASTDGAEVSKAADDTLYISFVSFSPDGTKLGVAYGEDRANIFDAATGALLKSLKQPTDLRIYQLHFSPDGNLVLAVGTSLYTARIFDVRSGEAVAKLVGHLSQSPYGLIRTGAFAPDGKHVITGATDNTARIWSIDGKGLGVLQTKDTPLMVQFSPLDNGARVLTVEADGTVSLWDSVSAKPLRTLAGGRAGTLVAARYSFDGSRIIVAWSDGTVRVFSAGGDDIASLRVLGPSLAAADISADGKFLITGTSDGIAQMWNVGQRSEFAVLNIKPGAETISFETNGHLLVKGGAGFDEQTFEIAKGAEAFPATEAVGGGTLSRSIGLSGDGGAVMTQGTEKAVVARLKPSANCDLRSPTLSPEGTLAAGICHDNTVRIWRVFPSTEAIVSEAKAVLAGLNGGKR